MALRSRHGNATKHGTGAVIETLPADELPAGVAAVAVPVARDPSGRVRTTEAARALGRRGGLTKAAKRAHLGAFAKALKCEFRGLGEDEGLKPFLDDAQTFYLSTCEHFASLVGGGVCSATIAAHVEAAASARMFGRFYRAVATRQTFLWDTDQKRTPRTMPRTDYAAASAQHFAAMRTALSAAHEYAVREAEARRTVARPDPLAEMRARIFARSVEREREEQATAIDAEESPK